MEDISIKSKKTLLTAHSSIDLSVFNNDQQPDEYCHDFKTCISIKRLLSALTYYSALKVVKTQSNQDIFIHFMKEIYTKQILDDYHHLNKSHDKDLENIMEYAKSTGNIKECDLKSCHYANRRYRVNEQSLKVVNNTDDNELYFYIDIMDSLHFHLLHLYDSNLRISKKNAINHDYNDDEKDEKRDTEYFDAEFSQKQQLISKRRTASARFERINSNKSSKFTMKSDDQYEDNDGQTMTGLDSIYHQLSKEPYNINKESINKLEEYVKEENFETESMELDLKMNEDKGNISSSTSSQCVNALIKMFKAAQGILICVYFICFVYHSLFFLLFALVLFLSFFCFL